MNLTNKEKWSKEDLNLYAKLKEQKDKAVKEMQEIRAQNRKADIPKYQQNLIKNASSVEEIRKILGIDV